MHSKLHHRTNNLTGTPNGIRTRAAALKGRCPRPLDDGGLDVVAGNLEMLASRLQRLSVGSYGSIRHQLTHLQNVCAPAVRASPTSVDAASPVTTGGSGWAASLLARPEVLPARCSPDRSLFARVLHEGHECQQIAPACWPATLLPRWGAPDDDLARCEVHQASADPWSPSGPTDPEDS